MQNVELSVTSRSSIRVEFDAVDTPQSCDRNQAAVVIAYKSKLSLWKNHSSPETFELSIKL